MNATQLTADQLLDQIQVAIHPSAIGVPSPIMGTDGKGILHWHESAFTRLELPNSVTGFGLAFIDYDTAAEAYDACNRIMAAVAGITVPRNVITTVRAFIDAE